MPISTLTATSHIMKIAYCVSHFPYQSETYLLNQLKELIDDGHDVTIFSWGRMDNYPRHALLEEYNLLSKTIERPFIPRNTFKRVSKAIGLFLQHFPKSLPLLLTLNIFKYGKYAANLQFFYDAVPFVQERDFDIVHCQFGPNGIKALNFREISLLKGALITSLHGFDVNDKEFLSWPSHYSRKGLYRDLNKVCQIFTVSSRFTKNTAINLNISPNKIKVLPVGLDTKKFKRKKPTHTEPRGLVLLTVARLVAFKGLNYSIEAVGQLVQEFPELTYHILGEGIQRNELEEQIKTSRLENNIFLHGAVTQEQALEHYNQADIFILPGIVASDGEVETQGLVVQEAQSMSLPVVITDAGGLPEGIIDGTTGFVVPQRDVKSLKDKIRLLLNDAGLREQMGKAGRVFVLRNYDNKIMHQKLMELYSKLL